jgi:protein-S-isoprenylcysteine O-methyltransferase Ste14
MSAFKDLFVDPLAKRLGDALKAPPVGADQLSVGLGGDIPVFPPLLVWACLLGGGLLARWVRPALPFFPAGHPLARLRTRLALFVVAFATFATLLRNVSAALAAVGTGPAFKPMGADFAQEGPFAISRNPLYCFGSLVLLPGMCVLANSKYMLVGLIIPVYFQIWVIPAEERLMERLYGASYADYCAQVPRWVWPVSYLVG